MGALIVYAEHRYFGDSMPFSKDQAYKSPYNSFLTVDNTLSDYVELVNQIKKDYQADDKAVIAFGGSYGGMLAAWSRMKYPEVFQGALASSAPVAFFKDGDFKDEDFSLIASKSFENALPQKKCSSMIKQGFEYLAEIKNDPSKWSETAKIFNTCEPIKNSQQVENIYLSF